MIKTQSFEFGTTKHNKAIWISIIFVLPIALRTFLGSVLHFQRSYNEINIKFLITDPSFISFILSGFIAVSIISLKPKYIISIFKVPLFLFVFYALMGIYFSLFTLQMWLGIFVGYEMLVYFAISSICIGNIHYYGYQNLRTLETTVYIFFSILIVIALADLLLPGTQPFSETAAGRKRFDGDLLPLVAIQWSAISSVSLIISLGRLFRKQSRNFINITILFCSFIILILSGTRGAFLGLFAGIIVFFIAFRKKFSIIVWMFIIFIFMTLAAVILVVDVSWFLHEGARQLRFENLENVMKLGGRTEYWGKALGILLEDPFRGEGIGLRSRETDLSSSLHNFFFEAWVGTGILGAILFSLGLGITACRLWRVITDVQSAQDTQRAYTHAIASTALAVLAYLVTHSLVESGIAGVNNFFSVPLLYCVIAAQSLWPIRNINRVSP